MIMNTFNFYASLRKFIFLLPLMFLLNNQAQAHLADESYQNLGSTK